MTEPRSNWPWRILLAPRDPAALVAFRIAFGLLVSISASRFLAYGWVRELFTRPRFHFSYYGFGWVPVPSSRVIELLFAALIPLGLMVAAGFCYRVAIVALFVCFSWLQLMDVANYLNHYYLVSLLALLLATMPLNAAGSVDGWLRSGIRRATLPAWCTWLLRFQVGTVYLFAGLAKLNADWLLNAQPLSGWLAARSDLPWVGPLLAAPAAGYLASWAGFLFDSTVPFFLSFRKPRSFAFAAVLVFHVATWLLFPIGMFPWIMITAALVFFDPSWPRAVWRRLGSAPALGWPSARPVSWARRAGLILGVSWCAVQLALPLRAHFYEGDVSWHEQGMRFSWRVMTREKNGSVTFVVRSPTTGREWHVAPSRYLTRLQEREMSVQPDLILQFAHHIGGEWRAREKEPVEVHVEGLASLNGRPAEPLIDRQIDLMTVRDGLGPQSWIAPSTRPACYRSPSCEPIAGGRAGRSPAPP